MSVSEKTSVEESTPHLQENSALKKPVLEQSFTKKSSSKRASSKAKRVLPEKLVEFQKTVKHVAAALGHSKHAFKLAKLLRDEAMKGNANASPQDVTKKANKLFDDNKSKWSAEHAKMKAAK